MPNSAEADVDRELAEDFLLQGKGYLADEISKSLKVLAIFGVLFGCSEGDPNSPDQCLASIWRMIREDGGALEGVIVTDLVVEDSDLEPCIEEAGVVMRAVERPSWLREGHEDWDERTAW